MFKYCIHEYGMSNDVAAKRILAARAARRCPQLYEALADGRLHLTAVVRLAPKVTRANVAEMIARFERKTVFEIKLLLAEIFPELDTPTSIRPVAASTLAATPLATAEIAKSVVASATTSCAESQVLKPVFDISSATPLSPGKLKLEATITQEMHAKLEYARNLLGHRVAPGDVVEVLDRALTSLIRELEKRKFAATDRPRKNPRPAKSRHIPAYVQRDVWMRDGGQCTYVSESGHRCDERHALEYDHIEPVARGGRSTVANLRLRCRPHNQLEAERTYGTEFMQHKREEAQRAAGAARGAAPC